MEKYLVKELANVASEARLCGAGLSDLVARLTKIEDALTNEALIADDVDEAKDAEEDKKDVEDAKDTLLDAKEAVMDCVLSLASIVRLYSK